MNTIALTYFIDSSLKIDLSLSIDNRLDLVLTDTLVLITHTEHSLIINGELQPLNISCVATEVIADVLFDRLHIFPDVDISILVSSHYHVAEVAQHNGHHC